MNAIWRNILAVLGLAVATQAAAQITFYEREGFEGRSFTTERRVGNFERHGFNDRASSVVVLGDRWEVCEDTRFSSAAISDATVADRRPTPRTLSVAPAPPARLGPTIGM